LRSWHLLNMSNNDVIRADTDGLPGSTWELVASRRIKGDNNVSTDQWQRAISIVVEKPQSVDKRLSGQVTLAQFRLPWYTNNWLHLASQLSRWWVSLMESFKLFNCYQKPGSVPFNHFL
jgi:hypothetical protein